MHGPAGGASSRRHILLLDENVNRIKSKSRAKNVTGSAWSEAGWQGFSVHLPSSWIMAAYGGDEKSGSVRFDNVNPGKESVAGLEIRWLTSKKKQTEAELQKRIDQYITGITKEAKKHKIDTETKSNVIEDSDYPDRTTIGYSWKSDRKAIGRIWYCSKCQRIVITQVVAGAKGDLSPAKQVLDSLECHPQDTEWKTWAVYDLNTEAPAEYSLDLKPQFMTVYVKLGFVNGNSTDKITVEQWGIANVQLRDVYLDNWFEAKSRNITPMLKYTKEEVDVNDHVGLRLSGRQTGLRYWIYEMLPQIFKLKMPATYFEACLWECPESNKVHLVQIFTRKKQPQLLEEIVERTRCHQ